MDLSITAVLSLFSLLALATAVYYMARFLRVPYTVFLVAVGMGLVAVLNIPGAESFLGVLDDVELTPELLFYIFLPVLIFESGYAMNSRKMVESAAPIALLAVVGMFTAAVGTAVTLTWLLSLVGITVPFIVILLFASVIAATDPVAVLAIFKELGAPKKLTVIFEGESLFNDGTAVALFLVVLGIAQQGYDGSTTIAAGAATFVVMVLLGVLWGLVAGSVVGAALRATRSNTLVSATLLLISAHLVFVIAEFASEQHWQVGAVDVHISPIIATTVAALFMGNYAKHSLMPKVTSYVDKAVKHATFMANSLVFLLAGMLFIQVLGNVRSLWLPMLLAIVTVATWRVISVFFVTTVLNVVAPMKKLPMTWQLLLSWGSLRGALAIIVSMLVPVDFTVPGWTLATTPRDFLIALTVACILVTLFIKAPVMPWLLNRFRLTDKPLIDQAEHADLSVYYLLAEAQGFTNSVSHSARSDEFHTELVAELHQREKTARAYRHQLAAEHGDALFERALHRMALNIEHKTLSELYVNDEISEIGYRQLQGKLRLQRELLEDDAAENINPHQTVDRRDIFDLIVTALQRVVGRFSRRKNTTDLVVYLETHRAQSIMAQRALETLRSIQHGYGKPTFLARPYSKVVARFHRYRSDATAAVDQHIIDHEPVLAPQLHKLAVRARHEFGVHAVDHLHHTGILPGEAGADLGKHPKPAG